MKTTGFRALFVAATCAVMTNAGAEAEDRAPAARQFTYAWQFLETDTMQPRGGTSKGPR